MLVCLPGISDRSHRHEAAAAAAASRILPSRRRSYLCCCWTAGADSSVLTSRSHVQAVRLQLPGRRTREDRPAQSDASGRAVDG